MNEHTKSLLQALIDGKQLEQLFNDGKLETLKDYFPFYALYNSHHDKLRVKQPTIRIGEVDVPEPLRVAPATEAEYWVAEVMHANTCYSAQWLGDPVDQRWLKRGLVHLSEEAAITHAKALILVGGGTV